MAKQKIHIKSFGCQMNKLDTALVTAAVEDAGYELTEIVSDADVVLINTCSVREHAEQKVISHLGNLKPIRRQKPEMIVGVIGCMAQRLGEKLLENPAVDLVCGPGQIPQIIKLIRETKARKNKNLSVTEKIRTDVNQDEIKALEDFESVFESDEKDLPGQAFVRVQRGCDNFCSYCIVPYVRGPEQCREPKLVIEQIKRLADNGVKLVTLLGQTVNSYEYKDGDKTYNLSDLLYQASEIKGVEWIRFVTSYPTGRHFEQICKAMKELPKVCNYLHMPAQSGSDNILKAMNRKYTAQEYLELLQTARDIVSGIEIAGDFIVGFPNETDEDFEKTIELAKKARYKNCFVFKYSPRPGTTADKRLEDNISAEIKKQRNIQLLAAQEEISRELAKDYEGKTVKILVEGLSKKSHQGKNIVDNKMQYIGRTAGDLIAVFNSDEDLSGSFTEVKITKSTPLTLFGEIIEPK